MRKKLLVILAFVAVGCGVFYTLGMRLEKGDMYPVTSSLRTDPQGTSVLYEALDQTSGYTVLRNFDKPKNLTTNNATVLFLGVSKFDFVVGSPLAREVTALAKRGNSVVVTLADENSWLEVIADSLQADSLLSSNDTLLHHRKKDSVQAIQHPIHDSESIGVGFVKADTQATDVVCSHDLSNELSRA